MMMPPPTPVPNVTIIRLWYPAPPPFHNSPKAATFASFPAFTGSPVSRSRSPTIFTYPQWRFTAQGTSPASLTGPGTPMPIPATDSFSIFFSWIFWLIVSATSGRMLIPLSSVLVLISHLSKTSPSTVNNPHFTVVPPTSIPKQYFFIF